MSKDFLWPLLYTTNSRPELQNVKPLTSETAKDLLEQFNKQFPQVKTWREKFLSVDFAEIEKRFLAQMESLNPPQPDVPAMRFAFLYGCTSGRFQSVAANVESVSKEEDGSAPNV